MHSFISNCVFYHVPTLCQALGTWLCSRSPHPRGRQESLMKTLAPALLFFPHAALVIIPGTSTYTSITPASTRPPGPLTTTLSLLPTPLAHPEPCLHDSDDPLSLRSDTIISKHLPLATSFFPSGALPLAWHIWLLPSCPEPQGLSCHCLHDCCSQFHPHPT